MAVAPWQTRIATLVRQLQAKVAGLETPAVEDTLPADPVEGQRVRFANATMAAAAVYWDLWWNGSGWIYEGGNEWGTAHTGSQVVTFGGTAFVLTAMGAAEASLTDVPNGRYAVDINCYVATGNVLRECRVYVANSANTIQSHWFAGVTQAANVQDVPSTHTLIDVTGGPLTLVSRAMANTIGGTTTFWACRFAIKPLYLT